MTDKELNAMTRAELLEMLIGISRENKALREQVTALTEKLEARQIAVESSGTMAEASLKLNEVFHAADNAARQYLENIRHREEYSVQLQKEAEKRAAKLITDARTYADEMKTEAKKQAEKLLRSAYAHAEGKK